MKVLIIVGLIVGLAIAALGIKSRGLGAQANVPATQSQRERFTVDGISYVVVTNVELTLSDKEWSWPPVTIELCQGIGSFIVQGEAEKYMVRDAAHPETNYSWTNGQVICFDGNPINNRQWMVKGIRRGPVVLRYHIYE